MYVLDPGPAGSMGDVSWLVEARRAGKIKVLAVQGILLTDLARAADFVLPGAATSRRTPATRTTRESCRPPAQAVAPPGDAMEDWQILVNVAVTLGVALSYASAAQVRADIAAAAPGKTGYADLGGVTFRRPDGGAGAAAGVEPVGTPQVGLDVQEPAGIEAAARARPGAHTRVARAGAVAP